MKYHRYNRTSPNGKHGSRILIIDNCYNDCPYAENKISSFACSFYFTCKLTGIEYNFNDNLIHFSTPEDCPLDKAKENG